MSLKKIEQVKKDRGFKLFDIIIYGAVIAIVVVLFIVLFATRDTSSLTGVQIFVKGEIVFEYEFGNDSPLYVSDGVIVEKDGNSITVTIQIDDDKNVVFIDKSKKTAKMIEANCKGKQGMYFAEMNDNSDFIYCSPHGLKVVPLIQDIDDPNIKI